MGIKINLSKAYTGMEWKFVLQVVKCFGMRDNMDNLIEKYISTTLSAIILNASPLETMKCERGLPKETLCSPFLYHLI